MTPQLVSIQTGTTRTVGTPDAPDPFDRPWTSAIWKEPVDGPVRVGPLGVEGDVQADLKYHGGEHQALLAYCREHYPDWRRDLDDPELGPGVFGENLSVSGLDERSVSIGDVWQIGEVRLEVSEPRVPCWKLARRVRVKDMVERVRSNGRHGWYLRVLQEGVVEAGDAIRVVDRPFPDWSVNRVGRLGARPESAWDSETVASLEALLELEPMRGRFGEGIRTRLNRYRERATR